MIIKKSLLFFLLLLNLCCSSQSNVNDIKNETENEVKNYFIYSGRTEILGENNVNLIGSASSVSFNFKGNNCNISLQSVDKTEHYNYVALELDGVYIGRLKVEKGAMQSYPITIQKTDLFEHHLTIYKATEATNGLVLFGGTTAELIPISAGSKKKIEFIGDSITCGTGNDTGETPCGTGAWYDQHNAYLAYGPILARALNADFVLSSVSGIGMYRNWNDEHVTPTMPDVYENLYLNYNVTKKPYDFAFQPDLVSICLGTNDFSNGDGTKTRLPFDEEKYVAAYIDFIKVVYQHAPNTRIILLTSPLVSTTKNATLSACLKKVLAAFKNDTNHKPMTMVDVQKLSVTGCSGHPNSQEAQTMANQLLPYFNNVLNEN